MENIKLLYLLLKVCNKIIKNMVILFILVIILYH
jgi:hypothetical protein